MAEQNTQDQPQGVRIINKLTVRDVLGGKPDLKKLVEHDNANKGMPLWLVRIVGNASDFKAGFAKATETEFVKLLGRFKGTNLETNVEYRSGACILPNAASDLVFGELQAQRQTEGFAGVGFVFRIGIVYDETTPVSYRYEVETVMKPQENDPLDALEAQIKALPSAVKEANARIADKSKGDKK